MKIEIDLPDTAIRTAISKVATSIIGLDPWDKRRIEGEMAKYLSDEIGRQIKAHIDAIDLSSEIAETVELKMMPTIREAIERELKASARKAVKAEMERRYVPESA